ncbi:hypothetical protein GUJ93_ZPchr0118g46480 [Zizania palustris]|uniref:Transmembrane protein n=1 Tax=Zizania palustris TaxID=103762 RepID=A0A8J5V2B9_ZIZPA|nr:hypothetical protein GUJ93_ZPchr0118g46480 [Zizania palustris]
MHTSSEYTRTNQATMSESLNEASASGGGSSSRLRNQRGDKGVVMFFASTAASLLLLASLFQWHTGSLPREGMNGSLARKGEKGYVLAPVGTGLATVASQKRSGTTTKEGKGNCG